MLKEDNKWHRVSLRFHGDNLAIDDIGPLLGIIPTTLGHKGCHIKNNPRYAKYPTNIWVFQFTNDASIAFEMQLEQLVKILLRVKKEVKNLLSEKGVYGELFLGFSSDNGQGGAFLANQIIKKIADLNLSIVLDLYPPGQ